MFEFDIVHRRSVAVRCMLYKIRCNPMNPLYGSLPLPGPYVPERVTCGALVAYRFTALVAYRYRTSQYLVTFIFLPVSLWNDLDDHVFDGVGLAGFKSRAYVILLA